METQFEIAYFQWNWTRWVNLDWVQKEKKRWNEKVKGMLIKNKLEERKKEIGCVNRVRESSTI